MSHGVQVRPLEQQSCISVGERAFIASLARRTQHYGARFNYATLDCSSGAPPAGGQGLSLIHL